MRDNKLKRSQAIVDEFMRLIATGELVEAAALPTEPELCERFGVGRGTAREAIQALAAKGLVTVRHGSGTVVAPRWRHHQLDPDYLRVKGHGQDLAEFVVEAREALEPMIAPLAAKRATDEDLARLRQLVEELANVGEGDPEVHARVDIAFHATLAAASGNPVLTAMHDLITQLGLRYRRSSVQVPGAVERAVMWHRHILEAIEARDPGAAADAMRMHLRQVRSEIEHIPERLLARSVDGAEGEDA
ncbi:FadR/GntR family transcriptional regulator [Jiangella asiatica]|uniref:FadR family transcriptional regulator n=1 Tax=Jiangella asiatica TaxID=2530372 RepID=A0A4R5DGX8_9ACTN|nr:FadR/GntR family transcriptional regulator [Jiangella asiatica]TDE11171.1 FadR family transcriptional regulator [Jiangella asiatica]